jgi:uncharacterized protein YyaL (SSP411 family)
MFTVITYIRIISIAIICFYLSTATATEIKWLKWSDVAFAKAKSEHKMILINVGIEVCYACNWMEKDTYSVSKIAELVMDNFIPIQVDANARPDIGELYSDWAWPATIFMDPNATQVLALRGSRRPRSFIPILNELIKKHENNELQADVLAPYAAPEKPEASELTKIRDRIRQSLDEDFDDINAGWGDELKEVNGYGRIEQLFYRAFTEADSKAKKRALDTAKAMTGRMDKVWGGFYSAGESGWTNPITEKRTGAEATAMMTFAAAYQYTHEKIYLHAAMEVDRYLKQWMMSEQGTFYTSQEGEADNLPKGISPAIYFSLSDSNRRKHGIPQIDHTVYTDLNARVIKAYVELYEATNDLDYLKVAIRAANSILAMRSQADGWIQQIQETEKVASEKRIHLLSITPLPLLRTQVEFGIALLSLHRVTGDTIWLNKAIKLADATINYLEDPKLGGFYATSVKQSDVTTPRRKPLQDNGVAARFFYLLGRYTKNKSYEQSAEKAIRAVVSPEILKREGRIIGNMAVALETLTGKYVEFSIVGDANDPAAVKLFNSSRQYFDPRKVLHFEKPGRYPDLGRATLYICNPTACSVPIFNADKVIKQATKFRPEAS